VDAQPEAQAPPTPREVPLGLKCPKCGGTEFKTWWQTFANGTRHIRADCAACRAFVRYLKQPDSPEPKYQPRRPDASKESLAPPPADWQWLGWVRQGDGIWRSVALCPTLARCWDTLLHYPGEGDLLCIPTRPEDAKP
jgi:hypothetical protein